MDTERAVLDNKKQAIGKKRKFQPKRSTLLSLTRILESRSTIALGATDECDYGIR